MKSIDQRALGLATSRIGARVPMARRSEAAAAADLQAFFPVKPFGLLQVHHQPFGLHQNMQAPVAEPPPLGDRLARHTKGDQTEFKAERPILRILNKSQFDTL